MSRAAFVVFALSPLAALAVAASCSNDVVDFPADDQNNGGNATTTTTGGGGAQGGTNPGGSGPFSCDECTGATPICVDGTECAAVCPGARESCQISDDLDEPPICCEAGSVCCPGELGSSCVSASEGCPHLCPDGVMSCGEEELCALDPETMTYACVGECNPLYVCGDTCCPLGSTCDAGGQACVLADLTIDAEQITDSYAFSNFTFQPGSCSFFEGCIGAIGPRRLMRFDLRTPNVGDGDLFLGDPTGNPLFIYSSCHDHYHFEGYARYRLLDSTMMEVASGFKQAFCLLDWERLDMSAPASPKYDCGYQGIQKGWADTYEANLPCQWVDVTGIPAGEYFLEVAVNEDHTLGEKDYSNNNVVVPITIPEP
jgi:hypothetical protein